MSGSEQLKGKANEVAGAAQRKAGEVTGNEEMEDRGASRELKGKAQQAVDKARDAAEDVADRARKAMDR